MKIREQTSGLGWVQDLRFDPWGKLNLAVEPAPSTSPSVPEPGVSFGVLKFSVKIRVYNGVDMVDIFWIWTSACEMIKVRFTCEILGLNFGSMSVC